MARYTIRLNPTEEERLKSLLGRTNAICDTPTEFFRLLLHREWYRCNGISQKQMKDKEWQTDFRIGNLSGKPRTKKEA